MPKDSKKEVKKVFPLHTTAQSNAYKEQLKVPLQKLSIKAMFCWWAPMFIFSRSPNKRPSLTTSTSTANSTRDSPRPINSTNLKSTSTATTRRPREIDISTSKRKDKSKIPTNSPSLPTKSTDGGSPSTTWAPSMAWDSSSTKNYSWPSNHSSRIKNDGNITPFINHIYLMPELPLLDRVFENDV